MSTEISVTPLSSGTWVEDSGTVSSEGWSGMDSSYLVMVNTASCIGPVGDR